MNSLSLIPEQFRSSVAHGLEETFQTNDVEELRPLSNGLSSALLYRLVVKGQLYVLRILDHTAPMRPFTCTRLAADANIAPPIHYANDAAGVLIVSYIEPRSFAQYAGTRTDLLRELANTIRAVHSLPPFPKLLNFLDTVDMLVDRLEASEIIPKRALQEHFKAYRKIREVYRVRESDLCPSHNDLNPGNILYDGSRLWVIDWEESAFQNDRHTDLAIVGNFFLRDETEEEFFLQTYFDGALDEFARARFYLMQQICRMHHSMLVLTLAGANGSLNEPISEDMKTPSLKEVHTGLASGSISMGTNHGKVLWGKALLNEILLNSHSSRFAQSLDLMSK